MTSLTKELRCAVYTRKSSDEGLEQEFNSLDAQREASEAYVKSQTHEGWRLLTTRYDDGGFSGGTMERPGLRRLLADIAAGSIDTVVVYKIDRLTRSLADFARIVELFDKHGVSFVSVTQSFNTTSSMGRLTLNVLLSFAQFEREVTGERIRDKIAASKAKGMWMGGIPPLGYDLPADTSRTLVLNAGEAEIVRLIFRQYLKLGTVRALETWLADKAIVSKQWTQASGKTVGGVPFSRGALYHLLGNEVYLGMIRHKGVLHSAKHPPVIEKRLFNAVQQALKVKRRRTAGKPSSDGPAALTGRIFDALGDAMSPTKSRGRQGTYYRYYVSTSLQKAQPPSGTSNEAQPLRRIAAEALEQKVVELITRLLPKHRGEPLALPQRVEVHTDAVHLIMDRAACSGIQARLTTGERIEDEWTDASLLRLVAPLSIRNRRGRTELRSGAVRLSNRDPVLISALQRAHAMVELDARQLPICTKAPDTQYGRRLISLAFLAPDLQRAIFEGSQPADLTLDHLMTQPVPADWAQQRLLFDHV